MIKKSKKIKNEEQISVDDQGHVGHNIQNKHIISAQYSSGPIPHSSELEKYEEIVPGAGDRIITMAEKNQHHLIDINNRSFDAERSNFKTGRMLAFILVLAAFGISYLAMTMEYPFVAAAIVVSTVASLVSAFISGRNKDEEGDYLN